MVVNTNSFLDRQKDFLGKYKGKTSFVNESVYFKYFAESLDEKKLHEHIIFCNDVLHLPPIYVFVKYYKEFFTKEMTANEKRGLGACFGYLFQVMYGYKEAKSVWVGDKITGIKNASYFIK